MAAYMNKLPQMLTFSFYFMEREGSTMDLKTQYTHALTKNLTNSA